MPNSPGDRQSHEPAVPSLAGAAWLTERGTRAVFEALSAGGYEARIVGGAVRNALLGQPVRDLDIATTAGPEEVMRLASLAGLTAIPTGVEHGTVTVVSNHHPFEVTTLRRDIETFGRHARVTYTTDWAEDARRRDFTINALYCSADGQVHDPLGGFSDLQARRVRFIGDAADRIREDYLRILRFFRFTAEYAEGAPDAEGLSACTREQPGMDALSGERIRAELLKLLAAPHAVPVVTVMAHSGIALRILGHEPDIGTFARLTRIETATGGKPDPLLRLAALAAASPSTVGDLARRLKLSGAEASVVTRASESEAALGLPSPEPAAKAFIFRHGTTAFIAAMLLAWARSSASERDGGWHERLRLADRFPAPALPVSGRDVLALGVPSGPDIGRILAAFETWWIDADFPSDPVGNLDKLREIAAVRSGS